jgi:hypothetical protein
MVVIGFLCNPYSLTRNTTMTPHVVDFYDLTPCCPFTTDTHNSLENTSGTGIITSNYSVVIQEQSMLDKIGTWFSGLSQPVQVAIVAAVGIAVIVGLLLGGNFMSTVDGVLGVK